MQIDAAELAKAIVSALRGELTTGFSKISAFARSQSQELAEFARMIAESRTTGSLRHNDALFRKFVARLTNMTESFTRSVALLTAVTLERAWNAVVGVLWGALNGVLGAANLSVLPLPATPKAVAPT